MYDRISYHEIVEIITLETFFESFLLSLELLQIH